MSQDAIAIISLISLAFSGKPELVSRYNGYSISSVLMKSACNSGSPPVRLTCFVELVHNYTMRSETYSPCKGALTEENSPLPGFISILQVPEISRVRGVSQ